MENLYYNQLIADVTAMELGQMRQPYNRYYEPAVRQPAMYVWPSNYNLNVVYAYPNYAPIGGGQPVMPKFITRGCGR